MKKKIIPNNIEDTFKAHKQYHKKLSKLPIEEKVKILVEMQKFAVNIPIHKHKKKLVWKI